MYPTVVKYMGLITPLLYKRRVFTHISSVDEEIWLGHDVQNCRIRYPYPTRDLKITHPVRLRRFRLKFNGTGRRGFILLAAPDHDSPEKGLLEALLIVVIIVPVHS